MNKKAQTGTMGIGVIVTVFIAIIVGVILFQSIAQESSKSTSLLHVVKSTVTLPAKGSYLTLEGQGYSGVFNISNVTSGATVPSTNYTLYEHTLYNGELAFRLNSTGGKYAGKTVNLTYTYEPLGYITDSAGRTIAGLVIIFFALGVVVVALLPVTRGAIMDYLK